MQYSRKRELEELIRQTERENADLDTEYQRIMRKMEAQTEIRQRDRVKNLKEMNDYGLRHPRLYEIMEQQEKQFAELESIQGTIKDKIRRGFHEEKRKRDELILRCRQELQTLED